MKSAGFFIMTEATTAIRISIQLETERAIVESFAHKQKLQDKTVQKKLRQAVSCTSCLFNNRSGAACRFCFI
jgi:hypothetical protein